MGVCGICTEGEVERKMTKQHHYPVMYKEVLEYLNVKNSDIVVDCTLGLGCHAAKLLEQMESGTLVGIDRDSDSLELARKSLKAHKGRFVLAKSSFVNLDIVLKDLKITKVDAFLFDLGISTYQLSSPERGFSFLKEGPLDMRMDRESLFSAYDLVNNLSEVELGNIFKKYGEERNYKRIAHFLVRARKNEPISTTTQLTKIINRAAGLRSAGLRIHPATRIFQALRIAVNRELEILEESFSKAVSLLNKGGRIAVISFHSLEDRITKHVFKDYASKGVLKIITKKPLVPSESEKEENPASRSAKLRVAQKN